MRLTLIPDLSREQDKSLLLRPTNIWLKSWTERLHGVFLEYVDRDIQKKNLTRVDRWDDLRAPKSTPEHVSLGDWQQYQEGQIIFGFCSDLLGNPIFSLIWENVEYDEMKIHHIYWSRWSRMHRNSWKCCIKAWNIPSTLKSLNIEYQQLWFEDSFISWMMDRLPLADMSDPSSKDTIQFFLTSFYFILHTLHCIY